MRRAALAIALLSAAAGCARRAPVERLEWTSMGTVAAVQFRLGAADRDATTKTRAAVQSAFARVEHEFSRFQPGSVLRQTGDVSPFGAPCRDVALAVEKASGGAFSVRWRGDGDPDYGAVAKGFAVDVAADAVAADGCGFDLLVDLGGNLKSVRGVWETGVRSPDGGVAATVSLRPGEALATSAEYFRGKHIHDARIGRPAAAGVKSVTVLARSATWADALSTALFILGPEDGRAMLRERIPPESRPLAVLWILDDGRMRADDPGGRFRVRALQQPAGLEL